MMTYLALLFLMASFIFIVFFVRLFLQKKKRVGLAMWVGLIVSFCVLCLPVYVVWSIYDHIHPSKWQKIILPLNGQVVGDTGYVEFLLPKQKYLIEVKKDDFNLDRNLREEIQIKFQVSVNGRGVIAEDVVTINPDSYMYHGPAFEIELNKTEGAFSAEIIKASSHPVKVTVAISTHIYL